MDPETVSQAVDKVADEDELTAARELARRKLRGLARYEPHVQHRRIAGALARRGFPSSVVMQVLDEVKPHMHPVEPGEDY